MSTVKDLKKLYLFANTTRDKKQIEAVKIHLRHQCKRENLDYQDEMAKLKTQCESENRGDISFVFEDPLKDGEVDGNEEAWVKGNEKEMTKKLADRFEKERAQWTLVEAMKTECDETENEELKSLLKSEINYQAKKYDLPVQKSVTEYKKLKRLKNK